MVSSSSGTRNKINEAGAICKAELTWYQGRKTCWTFPYVVMNLNCKPKSIKYEYGTKRCYEVKMHCHTQCFFFFWVWNQQQRTIWRKESVFKGVNLIWHSTHGAGLYLTKPHSRWSTPALQGNDYKLNLRKAGKRAFDNKGGQRFFLLNGWGRGGGKHFLKKKLSSHNPKPKDWSGIFHV